MTDDIPEADEEWFKRARLVMPNCKWCDEPILPDEHGALTGMHRECGLRAVVGGANHLLRQCTCCGGTLPPDPPHMSKRQAAIIAMQIFGAESVDGWLPNGGPQVKRGLDGVE